MEQKRLTVGQLKKACDEFKYLLVRFPSGNKMGINTGVSRIATKKKTYNDFSLTDFIGFEPCSLNEYITHKHPFL